MNIKQIANIRRHIGGWCWTSKKGFNYYNYRTENEAIEAAKEHYLGMTIDSPEPIA